MHWETSSIISKRLFFQNRLSRSRRIGSIPNIYISVFAAVPREAMWNVEQRVDPFKIEAETPMNAVHTINGSKRFTRVLPISDLPVPGPPMTHRRGGVAFFDVSDIQ